jgi:hypothetical protein
MQVPLTHRDPPPVRVIKLGAFAECSGLRTAILSDGLEEIEAHAFHACTSFLRITIPPTVGTINEMAFNECLGLMNVVFCDENEEFAPGRGRCGIGGITGSTISAQVRIAFSSDACITEDVAFQNSRHASAHSFHLPRGFAVLFSFHRCQAFRLR